MIIGRITAKAQTTVPLAVRRALRIEPGDDVVWQVEDGRAVVTKAAAPERFMADFSMFTEWADELDCAAFDKL